MLRPGRPLTPGPSTGSCPARTTWNPQQPESWAPCRQGGPLQEPAWPLSRQSGLARPESRALYLTGCLVPEEGSINDLTHWTGLWAVGPGRPAKPQRACGVSTWQCGAECTGTERAQVCELSVSVCEHLPNILNSEAHWMGGQPGGRWGQEWGDKGQGWGVSQGRPR